jgi:hypothetical protein
VDYAGRAMTSPLEDVHYYPSKFWNGWIRHDSVHFMSIIHQGYRIETEGQWKGMSTNAAFFPLYPYTVKMLAKTWIPGVGRVFSRFWEPGLILSNLSLVLALVYTRRIARLGLDEEGAGRSLIYLLAYPTSFFFSTFYSEGLFLLTTTAAFYHFLKGQYLRCGSFGFLAAMTRSPGIVLLPAFLLGHLWERRFRIARSDLSLLWLGLIPCGLATVMAILYWKLGDPIAFSKAHAAWGRSYQLPHITIWNALRAVDWSFPIEDLINTITALEVVTSLAFLGLPFLLPRRFHKALPIYAFLVVLMPLSTGSTLSMMRCEVVAFPAFFALARLGRSRTTDRLMVFGFALFLSLFKLAFANSYLIL